MEKNEKKYKIIYLKSIWKKMKKNIMKKIFKN